MSIEIRNLSKTFGSFSALRDISLDLPTGELVALLGPSGCGKTTLLRIIAGLEVPDSGAILFDGSDTVSQRVQDRHVGFVFQHYALFRHMSVYENVAFGLTIRPRRSRPSRGEIKEKVHKLLKMVQLDWVADRYPSQLSGGQRQRIALARALAVEPRILLLDEPFGALDAKVRQELRRWLRRLHDEIHITSIFVTHDQEEAMEVADYVVVMNQGKIEQMGRPEEVYHKPATPFVYDFIGNVNLFHGRVKDGKFHVGSLVLDFPQQGRKDFDTATIYVRPHLLDIDHQPNGPSSFRAKVMHINPAGSVVRIELLSEWEDIVHVELTQDRYAALQLTKGQDVFVFPRRKNITLWNGEEKE